MDHYSLTRLGVAAEADAPSFFEIIAHETTNSLIYPFILQVLSTVLPDNRLVNKHKREIALAILTAFETFHLISFNGSFTETFYGICRKSNDRLNVIQILLSLTEIILLPYARQNLSDLEDEDRTRIYRYAMVAYDSVNTLLKLSYLYKRSGAYSLSMWIGRMSYRRRSSKEDASLVPFESFLGTGLFMARFISWWKEQPAFAESVNTEDIPPPPSASKDLPPGCCPQCKQPIIKPVCNEAGEVYCKACIGDQQFRELYLE